MSVEETLVALDQQELDVIGERAVQGFVIDELVSFLQRDIPPREHILSPWLPTQGLALVYATRGVGKTFFGLNVAYAVASGGSYLKWKAPKARGVLYLDGEMPAVAMQERLANIVAHAERGVAAPFKILTPDLQKLRTPNLARFDDAEEIEGMLKGIDLLVVDNVSTLVSGSAELLVRGPCRALL